MRNIKDIIKLLMFPFVYIVLWFDIKVYKLTGYAPKRLKMRILKKQKLDIEWAIHVQEMQKALDKEHHGKD